MAATIYFVDRDPVRGNSLAELLRQQGIKLIKYDTLRQAVNSLAPGAASVIIAHTDFLSGSFSEMARLIHDRQIKLLFFCTDPRDRSKDLPELPLDMTVMISNLNQALADLNSAPSTNSPSG